MWNLLLWEAIKTQVLSTSVTTLTVPDPGMRFHDDDNRGAACSCMAAACGRTLLIPFSASQLESQVQLFGLFLLPGCVLPVSASLTVVLAL